MNENIFFYGDSYVFNHGGKSWIKNLANTLNLNYIDRGYPRYGILQTFERWENDLLKFNSGDQIIIVLSHPDRTYFFPDLPEFTQEINSYNFNFSEVPNLITNKVKKAIPAFRDYYAYLHDTINIIRFTSCWLHYLNQIATNLGTKIIVIPAFDEVLPAFNYNWSNLLIFKKSLYSISSSEISNEKYNKVFQHISDPRANHLCYSNHLMLHDKLIELIKTGKVKDIDTGWKNNILIKENFFNEEWIFFEFCPEKFNLETRLIGNLKFDKVIKELRDL
jgi:hypothetical protein